MTKVVVGSIPEKITYTYTKESEVLVGSSWDSEYSYDEKKHISKYEKEKVLPVWVTDTNVKSLTKIKKTASGWNGQAVPITVEMENKPISNIRVISAGYRGKTFKALIDKYYVDLPGDVLMDTMLQVGIAPGGVLQGEFIWAKIGSRISLIRIGSELHRLIMEFEENKDVKPVGKKKLEVGGIYQDRKKNKAIFLGYVNTTLFSLKDKTPYYNRKDATFEFEKKPVKKSMLFYGVRYGSLEENIDTMLKPESNYKFDVKKSHPYIEKVGHVDVDLSSIVTFLREKAQKEIKHKLLQYTGHMPMDKNYAKPSATYLENEVAYNSERLNLYPFEAEDTKLFDIKKFLVFS
jgi:hypothetical protein